MLSEKIQRLVDEYVGPAGSAAIVTRIGEVLFQSAHDDSACGLIPTLDEIPNAPTVVNLPISRGWCSYGVAIDDEHVLFVIAAPAVAPGIIAMRMKKAATLLRRVLATHSSSSGGRSGAAALVAVRHDRSN